MLLNYLISELMSSQMSAVNKPKDGLHIKVDESDTARSLKAMLLALGFPKPPENITPLQLFDKVWYTYFSIHNLTSFYFDKWI